MTRTIPPLAIYTAAAATACLAIRVAAGVIVEAVTAGYDEWTEGTTTRFNEAWDEQWTP